MTAPFKRSFTNTIVSAVLAAFAGSEQRKLLWDLSIVGIEQPDELMDAGSGGKDVLSVYDLSNLKEALIEILTHMDLKTLRQLADKDALIFQTPADLEEVSF